MLKFFRLPFATTGDKTAVPDAVDVDGNVSYSQGYTFDYQRQKTDPAAKNIERDKMNQVFFDLTTAIAELQSRGVPDFITSALNGGTDYSYDLNAVVRWTDDSLYISLAAANTDDPTDPTKWAILPTPARVRDGANTVAASGGTADAVTLTLTPTQTAFAPGPTWWRATAANATATPTVARDALAAKTLVKGNNLPLVAGDIPGAGAWMCSQYDAALDKEVLLNPAHAAIAPKQIQTVGATVAANALTLTLDPTTLDFRSTTLTSGAPVTRSLSAQTSLVVPSTATLGTVNAVAARLVLLAIDNAGAIELAVVNLAGGNNLDETTLISTTAVSTGADSANVIYSTTARSNVAFRVVGSVDIAEATAGTWATAPTLVQGRGGQALAALQSLGYGQSWQTFTVGSTRVLGTTYYNTTGRPINLSVSINSGSLSLSINGVTVISSAFAISMTIPPGASYVVTGSSPVGTVWSELR